MKDELDRQKYPRMPWHDVHCALWGPPCRDIARHFAQRWNHAKVCLFTCLFYVGSVFIANIYPPSIQRSKAPNEQSIPLLMPQHHMVLPHYLGRSRNTDIENKIPKLNSAEMNREDSFTPQTPPEDIPLLLPHEADGPYFFPYE